ncbi:dihydroneopterin aldolase [Alphaproteobacteria bacterium]|jgi:dihydroneopterin aldolase|nr:dihydroneopterin aldolase [Alphaproteobacteria bacterium]MDC3108873.1 dihydroneopterin aldolase [Alphaproteobacteria bacterium]MDC3149183.1 dihydroneopterin aldolase [Alphaproteobacteria bacterium]|tara:strand:- start:115 stop:462 length:348 start_codon:yes stop_codon:yes gene_type:complete
MNFFIEIEDLKVDTIIGVFDEERLKPQTILISIKCQLDLDHNQDLDNIENVTSYSDIKKEIVTFVSASQYKTLEKLITELKKQLDNQFPIKIEKLEINKIEIAKKYNAKKVSVSI